jgi:hypothetical protein
MERNGMLRDDGKQVQYKNGKPIVTNEFFSRGQGKVVKKAMVEGRKRSQQEDIEEKTQPTPRTGQVVMPFAQDPSPQPHSLSRKLAVQAHNRRAVARHFGRGMGWRK